MLHLSSNQRYYLYQGHADMRKGFDSLSGMVTAMMQHNPLSGDVYIFFNRRRNQVKLLHWEGDGFALYYKRLEKGTYEIPVSADKDNARSMHWQQLQFILQGVSLQKIQYRLRFKKIA
jgi:transposase